MFLLTIQDNKVMDYLEKHTPEVIEVVTKFVLQVVITIIIYFIGKKAIRWIRKLIQKSLERAGADKGVCQFVDSFTRVLLYCILIIMIGTRFGVTTASVIALLGSVGLAVGLSLQGSLSNFAGGVLILLLQPFRVGDYIIEDTNKNEGTVTEIQIFYTKLLTVDNKMIIIPNGNLSNSSLTNVTDQNKRLISISVGISYNADLKKAKKVIEQLMVQDVKKLPEEPVDVFVDQLGESAVILTGRMWVLLEDFWPTKRRITEGIKLAFDEENIEIPYNQLVVKLKN